MATVNMREARTHLSKLIERVEAGEDIVIARDGKPVARLLPLARDMRPREMGTMRGRIHVPDNFNDPMPPEELAEWYDVTPEEIVKMFPADYPEYASQMQVGTADPTHTNLSGPASPS